MKNGVPSVFLRNEWHTFAAFEAFEAELRDWRRVDARFSLALATKKLPWMKVRSEEVYPALFLCRHMRCSESAEYKLTQVNDAIDIEIKCFDRSRRLQVTTAGPLWIEGDGNWGKDNALRLQKLHLEGENEGWGPYRRESGGAIVNRPNCISGAERDIAYRRGLMVSLANKAQHKQEGVDLLVAAVTFDEAMSVQDFIGIACGAIWQGDFSNFSEIHVCAPSVGYYVKS